MKYLIILLVAFSFNAQASTVAENIVDFCNVEATTTMNFVELLQTKTKEEVNAEYVDPYDYEERMFFARAIVFVTITTHDNSIESKAQFKVDTLSRCFTKNAKRPWRFE